MDDSSLAGAALPLLLVALAFGYLLGSIPFGVLITRAAGMGDVRSIGSGNIGATNVLRTGRKSLAAATLLGDALKGTVAVLLAGMWSHEAALAAGLGAFLGHLYPVWLRFRGGKGVATYVGILAGIAWPAAVAFAFLWIATAYLLRYSSLAALVATTATPLILTLLEPWNAVAVFAALTVLVYISHRTNIARLLTGEESRIGGKAGKSAT